MSYLHLPDYKAWRACPGRPALEESEGGRPEKTPALDKELLAARKTALEAAGAVVEVAPLQVLDVGQITGEKGALAWATVILAEKGETVTLEVYPEDKTLAFAALLNYSILHKISQVNRWTPEKLYLHGVEVTVAAALSLSLSKSITALEHLVPGDYCKTCLAAYRCPALTDVVHQEVFGPLQAPDEPGLVPVSLRARLGDQDMAQVLASAMAKVPLIEGWCEAVRVLAGLKRATATTRRVPKRRSRTPARPSRGDP